MVKKYLYIIAIFLAFNSLLSAQMIMSKPRMHSTTVGEAPPVITTDGLFVYYKLDETEGTAITDSAYNRNATATGGTWVAGKVNNALQLNGVNEYFQCNYIAIPGSFTFQCWVNMISSPTSYVGMIIEKRTTGTYDYWAIKGMLWDNIGSHMIETGGSQTVSTEKIPHGVWKHIAVTYDSISRVHTLYIDGVQKGTAGTIALPANPTTAVYFGVEDTSPKSYYLNAIIDEVRIFNNRALSAAEILNDYNVQK